MRRIPLVVILLLAIATPAHAQTQNKSLKLNTPVLANQHLQVGDQTGLEGEDGYTIEAWIRPTSFAGYPTIVGNDFQNGFWLGLDIGSGQLRFWPLGQDQGSVMVGSYSIPLNQWTHVAASYSVETHTARLIVNGVLDATNNTYVGAPTPSVAPLCIGADRPGNAAPAYFFRGWIDEVRFWNRALGSVRIGEQRFHRPGTPRMQFGHGDYSGLAAYWDMEDPVAGIHQDRWAGNGEAANDATPVNGGSISTTVVPPIAYNHALYLPGLADYAIRELPPGFTFEDGVTIEAWVAPETPVLLAPEGILVPERTIVGRSREQSFWLGINENSRLRFYPSGGAGQYFEGTLPVLLERWTHVAAVYRPGLAELYVNGVLDATSTLFNDPPGENAITPLIGADPYPNAAPEGDLPGGTILFEGWLDEVRLTGAALGAATIREGMFRSAPASEWVPDELGVPRLRLTASLDPGGPEWIYAAGFSRFERSGAPLFGPDADLATASINGFRNEIPSSSGPLPGGASFAVAQGDLFMAQNFDINDLNVFVNLSATSTDPDLAATALEQVQIEVQHPGLSVTLMDYGDGRGRDLQTVFDDEAALTLAASTAPYVDGVRPVAPLANLDGFPSSGTWHLNVNCQGSARACIWSWGLSFNDINPLDAGATPRGFELRLAGSNPVRGEGTLWFSLPVAEGVTLRLLDVSGRNVRTLLDGPFAAGDHRVTWNARGTAPGLYFLELRRADGETRRTRVAILH